MRWKDVFYVAGPLLTAAVGAAVGGFFALRSVSAQVKRDLKLQCYAAFIKFHTIISSVTARLAPATWKDWYDTYRAKRTALEPVADDLIALTHLTISVELADRVRVLREEFDRWGASYDLSRNHPDMPQEQREQEWEEAIKDIPEKIKEMLDEVTREYRRALDRR